MGWEPVTHYEYDDTGLLLSSWADPEWDETQREGMLGLQRYRDREICPRCGSPKWLCQSSDSEGKWEATLPSRCHVTTTLRLAQEEYGRQNPAGHPEALIWAVRPRGSQ